MLFIFFVFNDTFSNATFAKVTSNIIENRDDKNWGEVLSLDLESYLRKLRNLL